MPLVTVAVPVHNGERFLDAAIESVRAQSYRDIEVLVLDDGSTDHSLNIIDSRSQDLDLRVISHKATRGLAESRNRLLAESRGDYIAWLDQDDVMAPNRLKVQVDYLTTNPDVVACGSWSVFFSRDEKTQTNRIYKMQGFPTSHERVRSRLLFQNCLDCSSVTMRRTVVENNLTFDSRSGNALDYDMWNRLIEFGKICNIPMFLSGWRLHRAQNSSGSGGEEIKERVLEISLTKLSTSLQLPFYENGEQILRFIQEPTSVKNEEDSQSVMNFLDNLVALNNQSGFFQKEIWKREINYQKLRFTMKQFFANSSYRRSYGPVQNYRTLGLLLPALQYFDFWVQKTGIAFYQRKASRAMIS